MLSRQTEQLQRTVQYMMREIAEQYVSLLAETKMLKADMDTLDPKKYSSDERSIVREIRNIRIQRIKKNIADITAFKEWVASISDKHTKKVIVLRYVNGCTWGEVANQLGGCNSADGVKHLCHRYFSRYGQRNEETETAK